MPFQAFAQAQTPLRQAITEAYRRDEQQCVQTLLTQAAMTREQVFAAQRLARRLVSKVRETRTRASGVDALMHEFSLSSLEGVALMCLAEALLRIPDKETADKLIRDKIGRGDWRSHLGNSASLFVNAAAWGLLVTGKLVSSYSEQGLSAAVTRLAAKGGEPLIRKGVDLAMRMLGRQFVTGETIEEALDNGRERESRGYRFSYDMLGEAAMTAEDAERYYQDYVTAIHAIGKASDGRGVYEGPGISVKLSAIHPRYSRAQHHRVMGELLPRLKALFLLAKQYDIGLNIDAEETDRLEISLDLVEALARDPDLAGFKGIGIVVQAYQKRCPYVIDYLIELARETGHRFMIRLVKGAYWDAEIKRAQVDGQPGYPVYTRKVHTDVSYLACARKLLSAQDAVFPQFATHNAYTLSAVFTLASGLDYEFQCLHGMGETLYDQVVGNHNMGRSCRIYAPVGSHQTLLAYLVRRLLENGANSSFVNRIVDESVSIDELVTDPCEQAAETAGLPHGKIPLPVALYGDERRNSAGLDLSNELVLADLQQRLMAADQRDWQARPMLADDRHEGGPAREVRNPACLSERIGQVTDASAEDARRAVGFAAEAAAGWAATPAAERAACLSRAADLLEAHCPELMALAVREAGKTLNNAIAEVREAVDFLRYYGAQAAREFSVKAPAALGPVVCISPWNFPLAIFLGEVSAALAAGNTVLAKPAEQTSLIAAEAVRLMYEAGVPRAVLQLLPGRGEVVGAALVNDARVQGVIFTGSTEVAQLINRSLAERGGDVVLVAETGGQNAMIVDSTALPEQVVTDVLASAFDSAGQRCSALRVLYLQHEVADKILTMIRGAMDELVVGDPARLATDVGPVIDEEARSGLLAHIEKMRPLARAMHQTALPASAAQGHFVAPTLIELDNLSHLEREVFGPVLHVRRFAADQLDLVLAEVNRSGYGLTHGVHSRIDETIQHVARQVKAGNVYVNRNIVGAVVGVQPFGGEGKSGTGPKAGGPFYLYRLTRAAWRPTLAIRHQEAALPGLVALNGALANWGLSSAELAKARELMTFGRVQSPLLGDLVLPGPTGEQNTLRFAARGVVACLAPERGELLRQMVAALSCDNRILLPHSVENDQLCALMPGWVDTADAPLDSEPLDAVLFAGPAGLADTVRRTLAARSGAIVPLIEAGPEGYELHRLVVERALCINTTAAGGNASLMSMEE
ncbi:trifunctional transcriptional regulator/proline dehydrogenase/L-glutamate gamma-semialdehyde dehydrogenase [Paludibacterium sp. B53371]|uniref:trifunctional transcriptional regulator/proline dehydrogenase/L-glutamate gamma-semialdehyde dehydrogenase n=1 Tax=Paludibacterium sp. B53371 TaxID=2806263 RepID=UPI001C059B16|nr:trifunctional transcriptional regulator/proline dehydrogenase/L-glutamate gamma-semialdehyde dehydrogenase [Paludibacterium sp. B53371]